jgi:hypothetical protein
VIEEMTVSVRVRKTTEKVIFHRLLKNAEMQGARNPEE